MQTLDPRLGRRSSTLRTFQNSIARLRSTPVLAAGLVLVKASPAMVLSPGKGPMLVPWDDSTARLGLDSEVV